MEMYRTAKTALTTFQDHLLPFLSSLWSTIGMLSWNAMSKKVELGVVCILYPFTEHQGCGQKKIFEGINE